MGLFNRNVRKASSPVVSSHRKPNPIRLALEALEERAVPAIEVTTLVENTNATLPLAGSLRSAIYFGSTDPSNTITFSDYLFTDSVGTIHSPTGLVLGNFTGTSHNDVVTVSNLDPSFALATNGLGNGILTAAKSLGQTTSNAKAIESGLLNSDSITDMVTLEGGFIRSYLGNGSGSFTKAGVVTLSGTGYTGLVLADLNNDGNLDVATATTGTAGSIVMSYGDGAGNFGSPITINLTSGNLTNLALADVNADGFTDLIATGSKSEIQTIVRDTSGVSFSPSAIKSSITGSLSSIALAALDTDAFSDAVVADSTGSKLTILTGLTNGSFASKYSITLPAGSLPGQVRIADINGDNKQDLIVPLAGLNKVYVYSGNGDGTFKASAATVDVLSPSDVRIADMTGDGKVDLVAASASSNSFAVFKFTDINRIRTVDVTNTATSLAIGAFDAIKGSDVISVTGKYNFNVPIVGGTFTSNAGIAGLPEATPLNLTSPIPTISTDPSRAFDTVETSDVNNDGKSDFIGINKFAGIVQSVLGDGDGTFTAGTSISIGSPITGLIAADFNLDGNADAATVTTGSAGSIVVISGSNTGALLTTAKYSTGLNNLVGLAFGDISGDGRTDLIALDSTGNLVSINRNILGTGFNPTGVITTGTGSGNSLAAADLNGDKITDAIVVDTNNNQIRIYLGSTNGTFTLNHTVSFLPGSLPGTAKLGDITADGKLDIVVALPGINQIGVVSGNGDGTFQTAYRSLDAAQANDIRLADMTGDGKLDIVASLNSNHSFAIFQFASSVAISPVASKQGVLVLNGSIGRLQFNNNTNLNLIGPGKFTEGAFANQYKLVIQSDLGIRSASVISGGNGFRVGDTLVQDKNDRTGGGILTVTEIDDDADGSTDGIGAILAVETSNPGSNVGFKFDQFGNPITTPTLLSQVNAPGLTHLTAFGPSTGSGAVISIDPIRQGIGMASGLVQMQMQTPGKNTLSISGISFGAGYQNNIFQGLGSLKLDNCQFNTFNKFAVPNRTSNFIFVQPGAGNLSISNSSLTDAPSNAVFMSGSGSITVTESLFARNSNKAINYTGGSTSITGSSFIENDGTGAVSISGGTTTVSNSLFLNNTIAGLNASALALNGTNTTITSSVFQGNTGSNSFSLTLGGNSGGAAILAIGSPMVIKSSIFTGNSIDNIGTMVSGGGAIYNFNSPLTMDQCGFEDNSITISGYPNTNPFTTTTTVAYFNQNPDLQPSARYSGGGAVYSGGQTAITNSYFNRNNLYSLVDYWQQSPAESTNPTEPQYSGGAGLYLSRNLVGTTNNTITNVTFTQNNAIQTANIADFSRSANSVSSFATTFSPRSLVIGNKFRSGTVGTASDVITSYLNGIEFQQNKGGTTGFTNTNVPTGTLGTFLTQGYLDDNLKSPQFEDLVLGDFTSLSFLNSDGKSPIGFTKIAGNYPSLPLGARPVGVALADMFQLKYDAKVNRNDLIVATEAAGSVPNQLRFFTLDEITGNYNPSFAPINLSYTPIDVQVSKVTRSVSALGELEFIAFVTGFDSVANKGTLQKFTITQKFINVVNNTPTEIFANVVASPITTFAGKPVAMVVGNIDNTDKSDDVAIATNTTILDRDSITVFDGPTLFPRASLNVNSIDLRDITLKDINGDNLPELLAAYTWEFQAAVWYNDGSYGFASLTPQIFACSAFPLAVDAGDIYGKGTTQIVVATSFANFDVINPTGALTSTGRGLNGGAMIIADGRDITPATYRDVFPFYAGSSNTAITNVTVTGNALINRFAASINRGFTYPNIADTGGIFVDIDSPSAVRLQNTINIGNSGINYLFGIARTFVNTGHSYTGGSFSSVSTNLFNPATSPGYIGGYSGDVVQSDMQANAELQRLNTEIVSSLIGLTDLLGGGDAQTYQDRIKTIAINRYSPARDAGTSSVITSVPTDARGLNRKIGYAVDIGAYEVQVGTLTSVQSPALRPADSQHPNVYFSLGYGENKTLTINTKSFDNVALVDKVTGTVDLIRSSDLQIIGTATLSPVDPIDKTKGSNANILLNPRFDDLLATGKTTAFLRYPGDPNNAVSETTPFDIFVDPAPVTLTLNPVNFTNEAGGSVRLSGVIDTPTSIAPLLGTVSVSLVAPGTITSKFIVPVQYDSNDPSKGTYSLDLVPPLLNTLGNYTVTVNFNNGGLPINGGFSDKFVIDPTQAAVTSAFEVVKTPTINLSLPVVPVIRGNPLTLSATVIPPTTSGTNDPTPLDGIVEFLRNDGSVFATASLPTVPAFGPVVYSVTITNTSNPLYILPDVPNNTIVARYVRGSGFYQTVSSSPQYLNLVGVPTTTLLSPSGSLGTSPYGTTNTFTATLSGLPTLSNPIQPLPGSVVQLVANGATVIVSQAYIPGTNVYTFSNLLLAPGTYGINARYTGDGLNYNASNSAITTVGITQATPTMLVAPINGGSTSVVAGAASTITLEATVTGATGATAPSGKVQFLFDGIAQGAPVTLVGGKAVKIFSFPTARTGVATTQFLPTDGLYNPVSMTTTLSATTLTFASSTNSASRGDSVTLKVREQPLIASGSTVEFVLENGTVLGQTNVGTPDMGSTGQDYQISLDTALPGTALINGNNSIYARYVGSNTKVGPIRLTVSQQSTSTALNAGSTTGLVYGAALNLGAAVSTSIVGTSAVPFTGTIQIVNLLTGTAVGPTITAPTLSLPTQSTVLPAGNYQLQAQYSGDNANFNGSKSSSLSFSIAKANANVSSATSSNSFVIGGFATLSANLASGAGGTVQFLDNGIAIGTASISSGTASLKYTPSRIGSHVINTVYSGDTNFLPSTTAAPLTLSVSGRAPFFAVAGQNGSTIVLYDAATKAPIQTFQPLGSGSGGKGGAGAIYTGGYRVATGDVTGDGVVDLVYSTASSSLVGVINGQTFAEVTRFSAYSPNYTKPVNVAVGDINGDGFGDIIVAPGATGTSPLVRAFSGNGYSLLFSKLAYAASYSGGVSVAAADVNGDRKADIICVPFTGTSAHVVVFNGANGNLMQSFIAAGTGSTNGFSVAAADLNGDKRADIILGALAGSSKVSVIDGQTSRTTSTFTAFGSSTTGARVAVIGDITGDGIAEILTASGANGGGQVRRFNGANKQLIDAIFAFSATSPEGKSGLFIG